MAQIHKLTFEAELKCSADKFYDVCKTAIQIPKILPQLHKSVEIIEGDGKSLGSVRKWTYAIGSSTIITTERITVLDDKNRIINMKVIEGELLNLYDNFDVKLSATPKGDHGCLAEGTIEYEKKDDSTPDPKSHVDFIEMTSKYLGDYLAKK